MEIPDDATAASTRNERKTLWVVLAALACFLAVHAVAGRWREGTVEIDRLPERQFDYRLDLNDAQVVELMQLPGIGQTLAERIVEDRQRRGDFHSIADLQRVKGIGPKLSERIEPYVIWSTTPARADSDGP